MPKLILTIGLSLVGLLLLISSRFPQAEVGAYSGNHPAVIELGKQLFFDPKLSANGQISCSSCHIPEKAFTDGHKTARGIEGKMGTRNTPSLWNIVQHAPFFWDGRRDSLEELVLEPFTNSREHGLTDRNALLTILRQDNDYPKRFQTAFQQSSISIDQVAKALTTFLGALVPKPSPFDRYMAGEINALTNSEKRGLALFQGRAQCSTCHSMQGKFPPFTDNLLHQVNAAPTIRGALLDQLSARIRNTPKPLLGQLITNDQAVAALGRFVLTQNPSDLGSFKTPSLRNVAITAPYLHDGSVANLADVVEQELYYRSQQGRPPILNSEEKQDLLHFLTTLTNDNPTSLSTLPIPAKSK